MVSNPWFREPTHVRDKPRCPASRVREPLAFRLRILQYANRSCVNAYRNACMQTDSHGVSIAMLRSNPRAIAALWNSEAGSSSILSPKKSAISDHDQQCARRRVNLHQCCAHTDAFNGHHLRGKPLWKTRPR